MAQTTPAYRVLARKYRPQTFEALIGQEPMVNTLANAIRSGRLAHAFILTGVRGVGKTTTARLIARALNCVGAEGRSGPTTEPCGVCEPCVAIAESRHVDVLEMDAASHTGVDDIREIIDGVRYAPVTARYKIYIIDEVHMLSKSAFNALLKTLEEPPEHVIFIFATTEIRKLPVTVLSRCQRFDLRRVESERLIAHFTQVIENEGAEADAAALRMIARAAEGSVRDGLSLLDQAIAHGAARITEEQVRDMLGLADRAQVLGLTRAVFAGEIARALELLRSQYDRGADPAIVLSDTLETIHWLTRLKVAPGAAEGSVPEAEKTQGLEMAGGLAMADLSRAWQMLLKGLQEVRSAPSPVSAAEMVLIRLAYAAGLPSPAEALRALESSPSGAKPAGGAAASAGPAETSARAGVVNAVSDLPDQGGASPDPNQQATGDSTVLAFDRRPPEQDTAMPFEEAGEHDPVPTDFSGLIALFHARREPVLATALKDDVRLVAYRPGRLVINPPTRQRPTFASRLRDCLEKWTGRDWQVVISEEAGEPSLREKELARADALRKQAEADPRVQSVLAAFPGATLVDVREVGSAGGEDSEGEAVTSDMMPAIARNEESTG